MTDKEKDMAIYKAIAEKGKELFRQACFQLHGGENIRVTAKDLCVPRKKTYLPDWHEFYEYSTEIKKYPRLLREICTCNPIQKISIEVDGFRMNFDYPERLFNVMYEFEKILKLKPADRYIFEWAA